ncbi:MAG: hypothetical protein ACK58L_05280 [Planctomycetota bacterium]
MSLHHDHHVMIGFVQHAYDWNSSHVGSVMPIREMMIRDTSGQFTQNGAK